MKMNKLPKFKISNLEMNLIQGGMGVGVSGSNLASAVANEGGAGIIASVGLGLLKGYPGNYVESNRDALRDEIRDARKKSNGIIGVNIMHALFDYDILVKTAVEENIDLIISGAGIPKDLPKYVGEKDIKLIPIVSSVRVAAILTQAWKKHGKKPDAFIVEGPKAGGHLGFNYEDLINNQAPSLSDLVKDVLDFSKTHFDEPVPVIAAGGIYDGNDIFYFNELGATGVQMATRFVPTAECDASDKFKRAYIGANQNDIQIIKSPVGMPGRAIKNEFLDKIQKGEKDLFGCHFKCLKSCEPKISPYCIASSLVEAHKGNFTRGFAFSGTNAYKCTPETCFDENAKFINVKTLMDRLGEEYITERENANKIWLS